MLNFLSFDVFLGHYSMDTIFMNFSIYKKREEQTFGLEIEPKSLKITLVFESLFTRVM